MGALALSVPSPPASIARGETCTSRANARLIPWADLGVF